MAGQQLSVYASAGHILYYAITMVGLVIQQLCVHQLVHHVLLYAIPIVCGSVGHILYFAMSIVGAVVCVLQLIMSCTMPRPIP